MKKNLNIGYVFLNQTVLFVSVDFSVAGQITDDEMSSILVQSLPEGVRLTAVMDSCHSGTGTITASDRFSFGSKIYFSICGRS